MAIVRKTINPNTEVMTETSTEYWDFVTRENLTAKEAADFLMNGMHFRTFRDNLETYARKCTQDKGRQGENQETDMQKGNLEKRLVEGMYQCALLAEEHPENINKDHIRRKVSNWMKNKNLPTSREEVFQICFSMEMDEICADFFMKRLMERGIHFRDGQEMIYAYCLKYHLGYEQALKLVSEFQSLGDSGESCQEPVTQILKMKFQGVRAKEDLISFMLNHRQTLGSRNNTAYRYFSNMLSMLSGNEGIEREPFSMEAVAEHYLRMNMPVSKRTSDYSTVQKMIKKYWPGSRSIKAMKSRSEEVSRKVLLLLYLVTGGVWEDGYNELEEEYIEPAEFLETHCRKMNRMLTECGMSRIDPRNAFDYLVLFSLRPENDILMSDRMSQIVSEIFADIL